MLSAEDKNNLMCRYKALYFKKYKIRLSNEDALEKAMLLVQFWRIIRQPGREQDENNK
jgi:hypothetical protein